MIKTHNVTGMKYLCKKSTLDIKYCYSYTGSGLFWKRHLKKYGVNISTSIIEVCDTIEEIREKALMWSKHFDVVNSLEWANLIHENGSNINDRSYDQMVKNRQTSLKKLQNDPAYWQTRKRLGKDTSIRQLGKSVKDRVIDKNWVDSRKGKNWKEIYGTNYSHPQSKPYKITLNDGEKCWTFTCESEIKTIGLYAHPTLGKLKKYGHIYIKSVSSRSKHSFKKGDKLTFSYL
jgi:hypothetical protein